jgi:hypothetical protein
MWLLVVPHVTEPHEAAHVLWNTAAHCTSTITIAFCDAEQQYTDYTAMRPGRENLTSDCYHWPITTLVWPLDLFTHFICDLLNNAVRSSDVRLISEQCAALMLWSQLSQSDSILQPTFGTCMNIMRQQ